MEKSFLLDTVSSRMEATSWEEESNMLFHILRAIFGSTADAEKQNKHPLSQREKDEREYELWVAAEEYKEE